MSSSSIHGGGIYASPERFERTYRASVDRNSPEGFTGQYSGKISPKEASDALNGKLPDGTEIPIYQFDEFKQGIANLPRRYGVVLDFELARKSTRGFDPFEVLRDEPNLIARAGGVEPWQPISTRRRPGTTRRLWETGTPTIGSIRNSPRPGSCSWPATRAASAARTDDDDDYGYDAEYGIGGDACIHNMARYVAVAPRDVSTSLRYLDFEL